MSFWDKYQQEIIKNCSDPIDNERTLSYWRNLLFANTLVYLIPLIALLLIPSIVYCFLEGYYLLIFLNIKIFIVTAMVALIPGLSVNFRKRIFCVFAFIHSIILLIYLGDFGGGLIFLMGVSIFYITIFPNKYAFGPVYLNAIFGVLFAFVIKYDLVILHESVRGKVFEWTITFLSMVFLVTIFSTLLPRLFSNMQTTIDKQKELQEELNDKNKDLLQSEHKLRMLNKELESRVEDRTKDLEKLNQQLKTFSYSISHDLQVPIRAINIFTFALEKEAKDELSDEGKDFLKKIITSTQKMTDLIQSLLKFSQVTNQGFVKKEINTNAMVKAVWINLLHQNSKAINFKQNELPSIKGDPILIQQVFENLLLNAVKYSSKREDPFIEVGVKKGNVFFVKDNGVGFDMSNHERIFNIFTRVHTDKQFKGTGVGLSMVKLIVEKHGGEVWVEAAIDKGATFYFTINT